MRHTLIAFIVVIQLCAAALAFQAPASGLQDRAASFFNALTQALSRPYAEATRRQLFALIDAPERCSLDQVGRLDTEIGEAFATTALDLLQEAGVAAAQVTAIGSHGQTLRHQPQGEHPFTWQIGNPHLIAERTGITTVAASGKSCRRTDLAGGNSPDLLIFPSNRLP